MLSETAKGYVASIGSMLIIGFSFLFVKILLEHTSPLIALTHRFVIAFIGILPFAIWKRHKLQYKRKDIPILIFMALLYPTLTFGLQIWGLSHITSTEAGIVQAVQPLITMIVAVILLHETISIKQRLFALLSVSGVIFIFIMQGIGQTGGIVGYLLLLFSVIFMSIYSVLVRKFKVRFSVLPLTFFCITTGALFFSLFSAGQLLLSNGSISDFFRPFSSFQYLGAILYLAILSSLVTLALTNYSFAHVEASKLGIFGNLIPVVAIFAGVVVMGDKMSWAHVIGAIVILVGVIGVNASKNTTLPKNNDTF